MRLIARTNDFIAMSVSVILLVLCSCNSVRMSLKLIKGNLLTYLLSLLYNQFEHKQPQTAIVLRGLPEPDLAYPQASYPAGRYSAQSG